MTIMSVCVCRLIARTRFAFVNLVLRFHGRRFGCIVQQFVALDHALKPMFEEDPIDLSGDAQGQGRDALVFAMDAFVGQELWIQLDDLFLQIKAAEVD